MSSRRQGRLLSVLLSAVLILVAAAPAAASSRQFSILQDDAVFHGYHGDPDHWAREIHGLGVEYVRINLVWKDVAPGATSTSRPAGHVVGDPGSGYRWAVYDRALAAARHNGLHVLLTVTGPVPYWASREPGRCANARRRAWCNWRPDATLFGQFVKAAARHYRGRVRIWSIWNEPNLASWLSPQVRRTHWGRIRWAGRMYRSLWWEAWKAVRKYDAARRGSVLFGETAPTHAPIKLLRSALCLDPGGRPYRGRRRIGQHCSRHPVRLPIAGLAHHPYNQAATGSPRSRAGSRYSAPIAYTQRLHRVIDLAARYHRIRRKPIYMTEHGWQSRPPDPSGVGPWTQARYNNESDRLLFGDRWVRSVAQYELIDPSQVDWLNTGLRYANLAPKPAFAAYRLSLVVTRRAHGRAEVWGEARPATGRTRVSVYAYSRARKRYVRLTRPLTNPRGIFRILIRRRSASHLRYQLHWRGADGRILYSRPAGAVKALRYRR